MSRAGLLSLSLVALAPDPAPPAPARCGLTLASWEAPPPIWARMVDAAARLPEGSAERREALAAARAVREAGERDRTRR